MSELTGNHARYVQSLLDGGVKPGGAVADNSIMRSWWRCHSEHHLDPANRDDPIIVGRDELTGCQAGLADLMPTAKIEMANLYQQLAGSGYAIMLSNADGVLLNYFGDPSFTHAAAKTGLMPGAIWTEQHQGTNGIGTCICERQPLVIHHKEHYLARNIGLTCSAAPIFDHDGKLIAVLDASGESLLAQQHTLVLVNMSAQMIENRAFLGRFSRDHTLRFHSRPEFVGTLGEGAIALTAAGHVLAANRSALFQLGYRTPLKSADAKLASCSTRRCRCCWTAAAAIPSSQCRFSKRVAVDDSLRWRAIRKRLMARSGQRCARRRNCHEMRILLPMARVHRSTIFTWAMRRWPKTCAAPG
ncbi:MAG: GAF domain-containing protein [Pseudomonadota bacterium]|nr:GAF domain-containing protein [Pseudomonadota bacterium]